MRTSRIRFGLFFLLAASALIIPRAVQAGPQWSGITGRAWIETSVMTPEAGVTTSRLPAKTVIRIYTAKTGRLVQTVNTDDSGRFLVLLQPGRYRVEPAVLIDGRVRGPGEVILMDFRYHLVQSAPIQIVQVGGFRYTPVTVVYHTVWPRLRELPLQPAWPVADRLPPALPPPPVPPAGGVVMYEALWLPQARPPLPASPMVPAGSTQSAPRVTTQP